MLEDHPTVEYSVLAYGCFVIPRGSVGKFLPQQVPVPDERAQLPLWRAYNTEISVFARVEKRRLGVD